MTLRIEKRIDGRQTVLALSGRIGTENLAELRAEIVGLKEGASIDLRYVTLVDVDGVRFLGECETKGISLIHCSPYIREWIGRESDSGNRNGGSDGLGE